MSGLDALLAGHTLVNRYRIDEVIGRGGFAAVYQAHDVRLDRTVAVKVITLAGPEGILPEEMRARFQREARASAGLQHPNVVAIYDFGTDPTLGLDFLVMERLVGRDLRARLADPEPIPLAEALYIIRGAAAGVAAGHQAGIIHRDVKPANVFLAARDIPGSRVCVLDFGIALLAAADDTTRLTRHGVPLSVAYASPEQLAAKVELTPAADVFGLGVLAYEVLARQRPFSSDPLRAADERMVAPRPLLELNPAIPEHVAMAVHRALAIEPTDRFADAREFAAAVGGEPSPPVPEAAHRPTTPTPVVVPTPAASRATIGAGGPMPTRSRRRAPLVVMALLGVAGVGAVVAVTRDGADAPPQADERSVSSAPASPPESVPLATADSVAVAVPEREPETPAPVQREAEGAVAAPPRPEPRTAASQARPVAEPEPTPARTAVPEAGGAEFRENLPHRCQSLPGGEAVACLNRDLADADRELNQAFQSAMSRLPRGERQALVDRQRAWLRRYDAVITSYYSTPWGDHSRVQVLPSQIRALRDRTEYLNRLGR